MYGGDSRHEKSTNSRNLVMAEAKDDRAESTRIIKRSHKWRDNGNRTVCVSRCFRVDHFKTFAELCQKSHYLINCIYCMSPVHCAFLLNFHSMPGATTWTHFCKSSNDKIDAECLLKILLYQLYIKARKLKIKKSIFLTIMFDTRNFYTEPNKENSWKELSEIFISYLTGTILVEMFSMIFYSLSNLILNSTSSTINKKQNKDVVIINKF